MNEQQAQAIEREADNIPLVIGFKRLSENATIPKRNTSKDSGFDVYASEDIIVRPCETVVVKTDIAVVLPPYHEAYIKNRSGVASKTKLRVVSPPIDEEYRGAVGVIIDNTFQKENWKSRHVRKIDGQTMLLSSFPKYEEGSYLIRKGDRIAQLTVQPRPNVEAVEITVELGSTERGANGFGSSGTN